MNKNRNSFALLLGLTLVFTCSARLHAQTRPAGVIQETDDEAKVAIYKRFFENRVPNPGAAYEAAREYMRRYSKEDDEYTRYMKLWMGAWERDDREKKLLVAIYDDKNFTAGYGMAKSVLADNPENVKVLIALGYGGYLATAARVETFNTESIGYAQKAIQLLEAGRTPDEWKPFQNKDDALASMHYAIGSLQLKTKPEDSLTQYLKTLQYESELKKTPSVYYYLGVAYQNGPYRRLSADYTARFADKPESAEGKAALENLNKVIDKLVDAYARAVALAGSDPKLAATKAEWMKQLTTFYKFRHNDSDAGLNEYIAGVLARPLGS